MESIPHKPGHFYHIYNRGNNNDDIFYETANNHFLRLYDKYINPVADTFAWCLLKNHFHFLVYIKTNSDIDLKTPELFECQKT